MTIPPLHGGGRVTPFRMPVLTAPVTTGVPPTIGEAPVPAGAPTPRAAPRNDAPISLGGRLESGHPLPDTTQLALALEAATRALQNGRGDAVLSELDAIWSSQLASDSPWYLRTGALQLLGRTTDAEQVLRDAIARLPRSAAILYLLGVHTAHRGQYEAARLASDHALAMHPTEPLLWLQRAALARASGSPAIAAEILARVQTENPGFAAAHWLSQLSRLGEQRGRTPTPILQYALARQTPSSTTAISDTPVTVNSAPAPTLSALEAAVRYGLTLLQSPTQSARTATQVSGARPVRDPSITYDRGVNTVPAPLPKRLDLPHWDTLTLIGSAIVLVIVPPLRLPALMLCGACAMLMVSRRLR